MGFSNAHNSYVALSQTECPALINQYYVDRDTKRAKKIKNLNEKIESLEK